MTLKSKTEEILKRRKIRNPSIGGFTSLCTGPPGTGKTSLLLHEANKFMSWYPDEIIFWRDSIDSVCQFNRIGKNYQVLVEKGLELDFHNLSDGGLIKIPMKYFSSLDELIDKDTSKGLVKKQVLNVIFFKQEYKWIDLLQHLRHCIGWQSVFIDEIEDIIPLNPSKRTGEERNYRMDKNLQFSNNAKQIRKGLVNLLADTQSHMELDWRFKNKLTFNCYLRGAKVDSNSRIKQTAVDMLNMGECFIDMEHRIYGKLEFPAYPPVYPLFEPIIKSFF